MRLAVVRGRSPHDWQLRETAGDCAVKPGSAELDGICVCSMLVAGLRQRGSYGDGCKRQ